jgi:Cytochrome P460
VLSFRSEAREALAVKRREFITLIGGAAAWPLAARAQQSRETRRIAVLMGAATTDLGKSYLAKFLQRLERLGWADGRNARIETRWWTGTVDEMRPVVAELVAFSPVDWRLISVAHEEGNFHSFSAVLGNDLAIQAYREGKVPFPDGAIIAALHYRHVPSEENNKVFGQAQSFVPGTPTNIQFMVKDTKKYTATGGWGFAHFQDGKPGDEAFMKTCFPCHNQVKARDLVFTRYAQ